jgi:hypothetical protein
MRWREEGRSSFSEEKEAKGLSFNCRVRPPSSRDDQRMKDFGSFFQKENRFLPCSACRLQADTLLAPVPRHR